MRGFTDIHAHFVYGVDDGAKTLADMEAMLDAAHADGITSLFSTPHVTPGVRPFDYALYTEHFNQAQRYCQERGYDMQLIPGAEILYTPAIGRTVSDNMLPTLGGSEYVLLEFTPDIPFAEMEDALELLERNGYVPVVAHLERYECLYRGKNAYHLKENHEIQYQMNCRTVTDSRGFLRDRHIRRWLKDGLVDCVATDAHDCHRRPPRMRKTYEALKETYGRDYADRLTGLA